MNYRPLRSALFMPGTNTRAMEKAKDLDADVLILDLEDSVAPSEKPQGLRNIIDALNTHNYGSRQLIVRVNPIDTVWGREEISVLAASPVGGLCLPKVESAATLIAVEAMMKQAGYAAEVALWAMIETPTGVTNLREISAVAGRLQVLVAGTNDLAAQLRIPIGADRRGLQTSLSLMVLAARTCGLDVLDGTFGDYRDEAGLRANCIEGKALGFDGKTLIHPAQLAAANEIFAPGADELSDAKKIVGAWDKAAAGSGVISVDGNMIEELHVDAARRLLEIQQTIDSGSGR